MGGAGTLLAYDNSTVTLSGGTTYNLVAYDNSTVNVSGGTTEYIEIDDNGSAQNNTVNISGGTIETGLIELKRRRSKHTLATAAPAQAEVSAGISFW